MVCLWRVKVTCRKRPLLRFWRFFSIFATQVLFEKNLGFCVQVRKLELNKKVLHIPPSISHPNRVISETKTAWTRCEKPIFSFFDVNTSFFVVPQYNHFGRTRWETLCEVICFDVCRCEQLRKRVNKLFKLVNWQKSLGRISFWGF